MYASSRNRVLECRPGGRIHIKGGRTSISTTPQTVSGLMTISCPPSQMRELWGQHSLSVNLCLDFMGNVVRQASFLFHVHNKFCLFFDGKSVEKLKLRWGRFHFTFKQNDKCDEIDVILLGVITMSNEAFPFHVPTNWDKTGDADLNSMLRWPYI